MQPRIQLDMREFKAALRDYMRVTSKDVATVLNTKALFIARAATVTTKKADKGQIQTELQSGAVQRVKINKTGKRKGQYGKRGRVFGTLAERILWKRAHQKGELPTYREMGVKVRRFINARKRSIAYIAAGWIPAIRILSAAGVDRGGPRQDRSVKRRGSRMIGDATPARPTKRLNSYSEIRNSAVPLKGSTGESALDKHGVAGLQKAVNREVASMRSYITKKLARTAKRFSAGRTR